MFTLLIGPESKWRNVSFSTRSACKGNSVVEYSLIAILVLFVCGVSLQMLNRNFGSAMATVKQDMQSRTTAAQASLAAEEAAAAANPNGPGGNGTSQTGVINPADFAAALGTQVATTGANGATMSMALQLQGLANFLSATHAISEEAANALLALAAQGLKLADLERQIEEASKSGDTASFLATNIVYNGQTMTVMQAQALIGYGSTNGPVEDLQNNPSYMLTDPTASPETAAFLQLYNAALNSPDMQNPDIRAVVTQLSSQISYLSDTVSNQVAGASMIPGVTLEQLNQNVASNATTYDSIGICHLGNGCGRP